MPEDQISPTIIFIAGLLLCLGGWTLYKFGIKTLGFLIGAAIGIAVSQLLLLLIKFYHPAIDPYIPWVTLAAALILGLLNVRIIMKVYYLLVFIAGLAYGVMFKIHYLDQWSSTAEWIKGLGVIGQSPWAEIVVALLAGILFVVLQKYIIIILTTLVGSALILSPFDERWSWLFPMVVGAGVLFQLGFLRIFKVAIRGGKRES